jgi:hypothetical protein
VFDVALSEASENSRFTVSPALTNGCAAVVTAVQLYTPLDGFTADHGITRLAPHSVGSMPITACSRNLSMNAFGFHTYMPCGAPGTATREFGPLHGGGTAAVTGSGSVSSLFWHRATASGP